MKQPFDEARRLERKTLERGPTQQAYVSKAQPAPSPSGDVPRPAPKQLQEFAKKVTPSVTPAQVKNAASAFADRAAKKGPQDPQRDFGSTAKAPDPKREQFADNAKTVAAPVKDAAYWQQRAKEAREAAKDRPAQPRDKSRDYDRDR